MAASKGNQFWMARTTHGRPPKFTPDELWAAAHEYFQHCVDNPLKAEQLFCFQGDVTRATIDKVRPFTLAGLCTFLGITFPTWYDYKSKEDYSSVCSAIDTIIFEQKFSGATAGLMNHAIIARDLGLVDKKQVDAVVESKTDTADPMAVAVQLAALLRKG